MAFTAILIAIGALVSPAFAGEEECALIPVQPFYPAKTLFEKAINAAEKGDAELLSAREDLELAVQELDITEPVEKAVYIAAIELKPIFESNIIARAIAEEFAARGFKKRKDALNVARHFALLPASEKVSLIEDIVSNLVYAVEDKVDLSNVKSLSDHAKSAGVSENEYALFLRKWRRLAETDYEEAKLIILDKLMNPTEDLLRSVAKEHRKFVKIRIFSNPPVRRPRFGINSDGSVVEEQALMWFLQGTHEAMRVRWLNQNIGRLSIHVIETLQKMSFWSSLPESIRQRVAKESFERDKSKRIAELALQIANLKAELKLVKQVTSIGDPANPIDVSVPLSQIEAAEAVYSSDYIAASVQTALANNVASMRGADYVTLVDAALKQTARVKNPNLHGESVAALAYKMPQWMNEADFVAASKRIVTAVNQNEHEADRFVIVRVVVSVAKSRKSMSQATENEIKQAIALQVKASFSGEYVNSVLALLSERWASHGERSSSDIQAELELLQKRFQELEK